MADHLNDHFTNVAVELNRKIVKSKNMHLWYLGSIKESNMFLTPTTPNDTEVLIGNMKVNKGVRPNSVPTKILKDYKSEFCKPLSDMINTSFTIVSLKWQILFLFIRKVTSSTTTIIDPYLFFLTLLKSLRKWNILDYQVSWIKIRFFQVFSVVFEVNIPQTMPLLVSLKWFDQHLTMISSRVVYLLTYRNHLIL